MSVDNIFSFIGLISFKMSMYICASLAVLAVLDFIFQRWQHEKDLRMTKQEVKEICSIFGKSEIDSEHLLLSLEYKKSKDIMNMKKRFALEYMLKSTKFVYGLYAVTLRKLFGIGSFKERFST